MAVRSSPAATVAVVEPRPCEVLHAGSWIPGRVEAWRRTPTGWRALVTYAAEATELAPWVQRHRGSAGTLRLTYLQWRDEDEVRAV